MKWAAAIAETSDVEQAVSSLRGQIHLQLDEGRPDVAFVFFSDAFRGRQANLQQRFRAIWPEATLAGCTALGVIGGGKEVEQRAAISVCAATLPGVEAVVRHVTMDQLPDEDAPQGSWKTLLDLEGWPDASLVLLADPFSGRLEDLLSGLDFAWPEAVKIGGVASGGGQAGDNVLWAGERAVRDGVVAVALRGDIAIDPIVAQGCRPIGEPLPITCCEHNLVLELDGKPPVTYLKELMPRLSAYDRGLLSTSLFLGMQMDPLNSAPMQGEYLVRSLVGVDQENGVLAVGARPEEGQIVQFHVRDKLKSAQDLVVQLDGYSKRAAFARAQGALMFSCVGRGEYLYGEAGHDSRVFERRLRALPLAGFFGNGEIGPVAGSTYIHGYTSSFGIFRPRIPGDDAR